MLQGLGADAKAGFEICRRRRRKNLKERSSVRRKAVSRVRFRRQLFAPRFGNLPQDRAIALAGNEVGVSAKIDPFQIGNRRLRSRYDELQRFSNVEVASEGEGKANVIANVRVGSSDERGPTAVAETCDA